MKILSSTHTEIITTKLRGGTPSPRKENNMPYRMIIFFGDSEVAKSPTIAPNWIKGTYNDPKIEKEITKLGKEMVKRKLITDWKIEILKDDHATEE